MVEPQILLGPLPRLDLEPLALAAFHSRLQSNRASNAVAFPYDPPVGGRKMTSTSSPGPISPASTTRM
jgi:hypothetical protein